MFSASAPHTCFLGRAVSLPGRCILTLNIIRDVGHFTCLCDPFISWILETFSLSCPLPAIRSSSRAGPFRGWPTSAWLSWLPRSLPLHAGTAAHSAEPVRAGSAGPLPAHGRSCRVAAPVISVPSVGESLSQVRRCSR